MPPQKNMLDGASSPKEPPTDPDEFRFAVIGGSIVFSCLKNALVTVLRDRESDIVEDCFAPAPWEGKSSASKLPSLIDFNVPSIRFVMGKCG